MVNVSDGWKQNQAERFTAESYIELTLNITDPDAQSAATATDNGAEYFSDTGEIVNGVEVTPPKYATLEKNFWRLDKSFQIIPDEEPYGNNGYVGNALSKDDGTFENNPKITISFNKIFETLLQGITITWANAYDEWATDFKVSIYNGDSLVKEISVQENDSIDSVVILDAQNYNKMEIEVIKWKYGGHRARISRILIGVEHTYGKADLESFEHVMSGDLCSAILPTNEMNFSVFNLNGFYDPSNPKGLGKYFMERQKLSVRYGYKIDNSVEWIPAGEVYLSEWKTPRNGLTASFTGKSLLEFLDEKYKGTNSGSLYDIAEDALEQGNIPLLSDGSKPWRVSENLKQISVPENLDLSDYALKEIVQLVANAGCCVIKIERNGVLAIEPLEYAEEDYSIDGSISYTYPETSLLTQLKAVDINDGQYVLDVAKVGSTESITNPLISESQAPNVAVWIRDILLRRQNLSGEYRVDPRLDCYDVVIVETPFAVPKTVITKIDVNYNGAFNGSFEGQVLE